MPVDNLVMNDAIVIFEMWTNGRSAFVDMDAIRDLAHHSDTALEGADTSATRRCRPIEPTLFFGGRRDGAGAVNRFDRR